MLKPIKPPFEGTPDVISARAVILALDHHRTTIEQRIKDAHRRYTANKSMNFAVDNATKAPPSTETIIERLTIAELLLEKQATLQLSNPLKSFGELIAATTLVSWVEEMLYQFEN